MRQNQLLRQGRRVHLRTGQPVPPQQPRFGGLVSYPDRPRAPQEVLDRGKALYSVNCAFCHASDAGGAVGPNLIRSAAVLEDQNGEIVGPIVHGSRVANGMPRIDITDAQVLDITAWLHSLRVGNNSPANDKPIDIVVGDAAAGKVYFQKTCAACHSIDGDLSGIATKVPNPRTLQQTWLLPAGGGGFGGGGRPAANAPYQVKPTTVTVTLASGQKVEGTMSYIDDFTVSLIDSTKTMRTFNRIGDQPKVEVHDPMDAHRALFGKYTDKEIHDLTAYLVTIK